MRHQPNSIFNVNDGLFQLSALVGLRALLPKFWPHAAKRQNTFILHLVDMHASNIFVDDVWNITSLIDLEFAPVEPRQMARLPTWLSGRGIDELDGANEEAYKICYDRLVDIINEEEPARGSSHDYNQTLRDAWDSGQLWYIHALNSVNAFPAVFEQHLRPRFFKEFSVKTGGRVLSQLWDEDVMDFIDTKVWGFGRYQERICGIFAETKAREARCQEDT
jgi:hypothetical protein